MLFSSHRLRIWLATAGVALLTTSPLFASPCQIQFSTPRGANVQPQTTTRTADTLTVRPQRPVTRTASVERVRVIRNEPDRLMMLDSLVWFSYPRDAGFSGVTKPAIRPTFVVNRSLDSMATSDVSTPLDPSVEVRTPPSSSRPAGTAVERGIRPRRGTSPPPP